MENSIFIQNLRKDIDVAKLCDEFRRFGRILQASIECDDDMESIGEAYITYEDYSSASNCVKFMDNKKNMGRLLHVSFSIEKEHFRKVYVKNFCRDWDECDLMKAFEAIGSIENVAISGDHGNSNGYGFISFKTHTGAKKAIECMNGKILNGEKLIVERFRSKSERDKVMQNSVEYAEKVLKNSTQQNNLHVKNVPKDFKESEFKELFRKHGDILSVKIATDEAGNSRGFGFVSFKNNNDAEKALKRLNGVLLKGCKLQINYKQDGNARKHFTQLKNKEKELKLKNYRHRSQSASTLRFVPNTLKYSHLNM